MLVTFTEWDSWWFMHYEVEKECCFQITFYYSGVYSQADRVPYSAHHLSLMPLWIITGYPGLECRKYSFPSLSQYFSHTVSTGCWYLCSWGNKDVNCAAMHFSWTFLFLFLFPTMTYILHFILDLQLTRFTITIAAIYTTWALLGRGWVAEWYTTTQFFTLIALP